MHSAVSDTNLDQTIFDIPEWSYSFWKGVEVYDPFSELNHGRELQWEQWHYWYYPSFCSVLIKSTRFGQLW